MVQRMRWRQGFRTSKSQRETIAKLTSLIAEEGYIPYKMSDSKKTSFYDLVFIQINGRHSINTLKVVFIKATKSGAVTITPYRYIPFTDGVYKPKRHRHYFLHELRSKLKSCNDSGDYTWKGEVTEFDDPFAWLNYIKPVDRKRALDALCLYTTWLAYIQPNG